MKISAIYLGKINTICSSAIEYCGNMYSLLKRILLSCAPSPVVCNSDLRAKRSCVGALVLHCDKQLLVCTIHKKDRIGVLVAGEAIGVRATQQISGGSRIKDK